jgi:hypothetical protein
MPLVVIPLGPSGDAAAPYLSEQILEGIAIGFLKI